MGRSDPKSSEERVSECVSFLQEFCQIRSPVEILCPSLTKEGRQCQNKRTVKEGDGTIGHVRHLLRLLQADDETSSVDEDHETDHGINSASLSVEELVSKISSCGKHRALLTAAILDWEPELSNSTANSVDVELQAEDNAPSTNEYPHTPIKKERAVQNGKPDSSHYRPEESPENKTTASREVLTETPPHRPRLSVLQFDSPLEDSPFTGSASSYSNFTETPQSTFSLNTANELTPLTPPSTGPSPRPKRFTRTALESPAVARRTRQNLAKLRGDCKPVEYFPPTRTNGSRAKTDDSSETDAQEQEEYKQRSFAGASAASGEEWVDADADEPIKSKEEHAQYTPEHPRKLFFPPEKTHREAAKHPVLTPTAPPPQATNPTPPTQQGPCRTPKLQPLGPGNHMYKIFELLEKSFGKQDSGAGYIYIAVHSHYTPAPGDDKRLFKIGYTTSSIKGRYQHEKCKHVSQYSEFVAKSEKAFKGARRAEQLVLADLFMERRYIVDCDHCGTKSKAKANKGAMIPGTHKEWVVATKERVREAVDRWTRFVQLESVYVNGHLSPMAQDYLAEFLAPRGLVAKLESRAGVHPSNTQKQNLIVFERPELMNNADAAADEIIRQRNLQRERALNALAQPVPAQDAATTDNSVPASRRSSLASTHPSIVPQPGQQPSKKAAKDKASPRGWDLVYKTLKDKGGLKRAKEAIKRHSKEAIEPEGIVKGNSEPKLGLVRRATGQFFQKLK